MREDFGSEEITFGAELAGLLGVFAISLLGPWEDDGGGWGFYTAGLVLCITAFLAGRRPQWPESLLTGAAVGFFGTVLYILGSVLVYELGWYERSGGGYEEVQSFLESDASAASILLGSLFYGIPAGAIGAILAGIGHFAVDRWGGV